MSFEIDLTDNQHRRKTREISVGNLKLGGANPVRVQSMTTPKTEDVDAVVKQILELETAGCEIIRITVNEQEAADALPPILAKDSYPGASPMFILTIRWRSRR